MAKLKKEHVVTLRDLKARGASNAAIAETLGVTEGTVRYHLGKDPDKADGRSGRPVRLDGLRPVIEEFLRSHGAAVADRPLNVKLLYERLCDEHAYTGCYRSVLRYVEKIRPKPKLRPFRRVELPPGAQAQVDWAHFPAVRIADEAGPRSLNLFLMTLSWSRRTVAIWSERMDQLSWHRCHNEAIRRLGGLPASLRIDNLKTGVGVGAGPWGELNRAYKAYAKTVGFHVDACLPRHAWHKGKVERSVRSARGRITPGERTFLSLAELQAWTDEVLERFDSRRICPATGDTVAESFLREAEALKRFERLPEPFDVEVRRKVSTDCLVSFEGRRYSVPFIHIERRVTVRGCSGRVRISFDGAVIAEHERGTKEKLLVDPAHYEGPGDERVAAPTPLGRVARTLLAESGGDRPVELRAVDFYARLIEGAA